MNPHELKNRDKTRAKKKGGETKGDKNQIKKRRKDNKTLSQKSKKGWKKNFDEKAIKEKEPKIKVLAQKVKNCTGEKRKSKEIGYSPSRSYCTKKTIRVEAYQQL
jgi:hypothetical protein